jgi:hypothetical protein
MSHLNDIFPRARQEKLVVRTLDDEVLLYDLERHKAHCLSPAAAIVWKHCDGSRTPAQLAEVLETELGCPISAEAVGLILQHLQKHKLLEDIVLPEVGISRREAAKRLGIAALAIPFVTTLLAPTVAQAATCKTAGQVCTSNGECCSGICQGLKTKTCR